MAGDAKADRDFDTAPTKYECAVQASMPATHQVLKTDYVGEFHNALKPGWEVEYEQLSAGMFRGELEHLRCDGIEVLHGRGDRAVLQRGQIWDGARSIGVIRAADDRGLFLRSNLHNDRWVTFKHGDDFEYRTAECFDNISLNVNDERLATYLSEVKGVDIDDLALSSHSLLSEFKKTEEFRRTLLTILANVRESPEMLAQARSRKWLATKLLDASAELICGTLPQPKAGPPTGKVKHEIVKRARDYMYAHLHENIQIPELCLNLKVSQRSLQQCFSDVLGLSPKTYLKTIRLNAVRKELARAEKHRSVGDVAASFGLWHTSRFSADYKKLFAEYPSQTLSHAPRKR